MSLSDYQHLSDRDLVARANEGDGDAFAELYERYRDWIIGVAHRLSGDRDIALDTLQEVMRYWLAKFANPAVPFVLTSEVKSFLYPAIRSVVIGTARRRLRALTDIAEVEVEARSATGATGEISVELARAIERLPEGQREVLLLHFGDGLTLAAVAEALCIPIGTVKSRLGLALRSLRSEPGLADAPPGS